MKLLDFDRKRQKKVIHQKESLDKAIRREFHSIGFYHRPILYPSLLEDEDSNGTMANAKRILEDYR